MCVLNCKIPLSIFVSPVHLFMLAWYGAALNTQIKLLRDPSIFFFQFFTCVYALYICEMCVPCYHVYLLFWNATLPKTENVPPPIIKFILADDFRISFFVLPRARKFLDLQLSFCWKTTQWSKEKISIHSFNYVK